MAVAFRMTVTGLPLVQDALRRVGRNAPTALARALTEEAEEIIGESKLEVPVKTGALRASGVVLPTVIAFGGAVTVEAGYGGPAAPYALAVHENLGISHSPPTKAKYLEDPFNRAMADFERRVADKIVLRGVS